MSGGGAHLKDEGSRLQVVSAGAIAGLVSRFCIAPLDVLKIRLQLQIHSLSDPLDTVRKARYGAVVTFTNILRDEGVTAFWKGNLSAELLYINYGAVQFSTYRLATQTLYPLHLPNGAEAFISGAIAGASATTVTYPLDLLRTRFAAQGRDRIYANLRSGVRDIWREEGAKGFFQGLGAGVGQVVPYMGLFFCAYETLRPRLAKLSLPFGSGDATAGVLSGVLAKTGVFPLDLIRKRLQVQGPSRARYVGGKIPVYGEGVLRTGRSIVRREGWRGLYRGLGVGLVKSAPASAVTMWTYERAMKVMKEMELAKVQ
ncbi:mitochondrial thiamine pyrophosphate transporter [Lecanora helva]